MQKPCTIPPWVGVISCCSKLAINAAKLFQQFDKNRIPYLNPARDIVEWQNKMKPGLILSAIDALPYRCTHVLQLDALDVMLNGDFGAAIHAYKEYGVPVLFGASRNNYPNRIIDKVRDRDWRGNFRYLNAGTSFGVRKKMRDFYEIVSKIDIEDNENEQILVRIAFSECQSWVDYDWRCCMFQTFSGANVRYSDDYSITVY
jgi:hypothetical protein